MSDLFLKASRLKLRFDSAKGPINVEDLWDLPITSDKKMNLADIGLAIKAKLDSVAGLSFVKQAIPTADATDQLRFDIIRHVIETKQEENAAASTARDNAQKKQRILQLIAEKEDDSLKGKSLDDLKAMAESL
jgi:putative N-acetylmannosamine-6-phosphate epimerase